MPVDPSYRDFILDQLAKLPGVTARPMFGGYGLYKGSLIFGILDDNRTYFRVGATTRAEFEARGMGPFSPSPKQVMRSYYEVPEEVLENPDELASWARKALAVKR